MAADESLYPIVPSPGDNFYFPNNDMNLCQNLTPCITGITPESDPVRKDFLWNKFNTERLEGRIRFVASYGWVHTAHYNKKVQVPYYIRVQGIDAVEAYVKEDLGDPPAAGITQTNLNNLDNFYWIYGKSQFYHELYTYDDCNALEYPYYFSYVYSGWRIVTNTYASVDVYEICNNSLPGCSGCYTSNEFGICIYDYSSPGCASTSLCGSDEYCLEIITENDVLALESFNVVIKPLAFVPNSCLPPADEVVFLSYSGISIDCKTGSSKYIENGVDFIAPTHILPNEIFEVSIIKNINGNFIIDAVSSSTVSCSKKEVSISCNSIDDRDEIDNLCSTGIYQQEKYCHDFFKTYPMNFQ